MVGALIRLPEARNRRILIGLGALYVLIAAVALMTTLAPIVPVLFLAMGVGLLAAGGSTWHALLVVLGFIMFVPILFSVRIGGVSVSFARTLYWAVAIGWLANMRRRDRDFTIQRSPFDMAMLAVVASMTLATVMNLPLMSNQEVLGALRRVALFAVDFFLLFVIVLSALHRPGRTERMMKIFTLLVTATAVVGLIEHILGRSIFEDVAKVLPPAVGRTLTEVVQSTPRARGFINRVRSTLEHPLAFGIVLNMALPMAAVFAMRAKQNRARVGWVVTALLIGSAILLTAGRSIYALAGLTFLTMLVLLPDRRARLGVFALALMIGALFVSQSDVRRTMFSFFKPYRGGVLEGSINSRVLDYRPVLERVEQKPIAGWGPRTFSRPSLARNNLVPDPVNMVLDNTYLGHLAETGVIGLLALLSLMAVVYATAWRSLRLAPDRDSYLFRLGLLIAAQNWILMGFAADTYNFNAPPRLFSFIMAAIAAERIASGWTPRYSRLREVEHELAEEPSASAHA